MHPLLVSFYEDPGWWHERLILQSVSQGARARSVIVTPDEDMYDECMAD